jgi:hypothetical protein
MKCMGLRILILCTCFASIFGLQAQTTSKHKIITFNAPGAGKGSGEGTVPISINLAG